MKTIRRTALNWCGFLQKGKRTIVIMAVSSMLAVSGLGTTGIVHAAGTATLSLTPATATKNVGDTVQFDIVVDVDGGGDPANAVQANLDYPAAFFDSGTATCGSTFSLQAQSQVSAGVIKLACAIPGGNPPVTGVVTVGTVTLHASAATAPSAPNVTFRLGASESAVTSSVDSSDMLTSNTGGTYTINAVSSGGGTGGTQGGTSGASTSTPAAPNTGFALLEAHPVVTLGVTTLAAGLILGLAQRFRRLTSEH